MNDRELSNKLADALEGLLRPLDDRMGYIANGMKADNARQRAQEALALHRAQRDVEMEYRMLKEGDIIQIGDQVRTGGKKWEDVLGVIGESITLSDEGYFRRPLAKGEA